MVATEGRFRFTNRAPFWRRKDSLSCRHLVKMNGIDRHHPTFAKARQRINYYLS
jgi:hypothetical protein